MLKGQKKILILCLFSLLFLIVFRIDSRKKHTLILDNKVIFTDDSTCNLQDINTTINPKFFHAEKFTCTFPPRLFKTNETHLLLLEQNLVYYTLEPFINLNCIYNSFSKSREQIPFGQTFSVGKVTKIKNQFIRVSCYKGFTLIYTDFFYFFPTNFVQKARASKFNVIVLGIDSMSKMNFRRTLPKTLKYLKEMGVVEYHGFSKVRGEDLANIVPMVTGMSVDDIRKDCWKDELFFDRCRFIWRLFRDQNYITSFGEDNTNKGIFVGEKMGFYRNPVDYFYNTYNLMTDRMIGNTLQFLSNMCLGSEFQYNNLLKYMSSFARTHGRRRKSSWNFFGFYWMKSLSYHSLGYPKFGDNSLLNFLKSIQIVNNTLIFILSNHGFKWLPFRGTPEGKIEANRPGLYIVLPKSFQVLYPSAAKNLRNNYKKLVTPFDIYETLKDIAVDLTNKEPAVGRSLFKEMPSRTCKDAGILPTFCPCLQWTMINVTNSQVRYIVDVAIKRVNIENVCPPVRLIEIIRASIAADEEKYIFLILFAIEDTREKKLYEISVSCVNCKDQRSFSTIIFEKIVDHEHAKKCLEKSKSFRYNCFCSR